MYVEIIVSILHYLPWPIVVLIFIKMFKKPIFDFLRRLEMAKVYGVSVKAEILPDQPKEISLPKSEKEIIKDIRKEDKKVITKYIELLEKYKFEQTLHAIYGTQMDLLEYLSKKGTLGEKYINLTRFYSYFLIRSRFMATTPITNYFGFLKNMGYIKYVGEGDERIVTITPHGLNFLSYIKELYPTTYRYRSF